MAMIGLDVGEVRQLARDLHGEAEQIHNVVAQIDRITQQVTQVWRGHDAERFRDWWTSEHAPALRRAVEAVEGLSRSAARNADDQERASLGQGDSPGSAAGSSSSVSSLVSMVSTAAGAEINGTRPWDLVTSLGVAGELQGLKGFHGIGVVGDVVSAFEYSDKIINGQFDSFDGADLTADVMGNFPVYGQLGGAAIHIWADAGRAAMEADWSNEAMRETWDYARENPGVVAEELGKAVLQVGSKLPGYFNLP